MQTKGAVPYRLALKQEMLLLSAHGYSLPITAITNDYILKAETGQMYRLTGPNTEPGPGSSELELGTLPLAGGFREDPFLCSF